MADSPRPDDSDGTPVAGASQAPGETPELSGLETGRQEGSRAASRWWWALLVVAAVEFWIYGFRAEIEVCVGKEGVTDFALDGQERTDENRWSFPRCETRLNLGLRSRFDENVAEATKASCRGATIFKHQGEGPACVEATEGWQHRVETRFIPPWDQRYYEHLLWFLF
jgi:hypothetical protein